ncbi:MAG TPA: hypothetical protein PLZ60_12660, partial [Kiritimatiellia bacterium]|nr:hypothetical protein [Kiritimatiellia bacterium]
LVDKVSLPGSHGAPGTPGMKPSPFSAATFRKRVASGLQTSRSFIIPHKEEQASETSDFELVTWLVIRQTA